MITIALVDHDQKDRVVRVRWKWPNVVQTTASSRRPLAGLQVDVAGKWLSLRAYVDRLFYDTKAAPSQKHVLQEEPQEMASPEPEPLQKP